jgi:TusA-related sulfurtransferase
MGKVAVGDVIEVWSSDPVTKTDMGAWAGKVGHEFLGVIEADGYDRVFLRRGK